MIDRLSQLKTRNPHVSSLNHPASDNTILPIEGEGSPNTEGIDQDFFEKIKVIKALLQRITGNNQEIEELRQKFYRAIKALQEKDATSRLETLVTENKGTHAKLKGILESLRLQVEDAEGNPDLVDEPETRMKRNFYTTTANEVMKVLKEESAQEDAFKSTVRQKLTRQVKIIDRNLTDDQVEYYASHPEEAQQMLQARIVGQASHNLKNAVTDIQDKYRDIQLLETSVNECLQLFKELSAMVFRQGELIDNIEANCMNAKDYVQKAVVKLGEAKKHHACSKKCMCILIIVGIALLLVVLIPIIVTFTKK